MLGVWAALSLTMFRSPSGAETERAAGGRTVSRPVRDVSGHAVIVTDSLLAAGVAISKVLSSTAEFLRWLDSSSSSSSSFLLVF